MAEKTSNPPYAESFGVASAQRSTSNIESKRYVKSSSNADHRVSAGTQGAALSQSTVGAIWRSPLLEGTQTGLSAPRGKKMLQFLACHGYPAYCILYIQPDSHAITCCCLVFTGCWRRCSPVFASYSNFNPSSP